MFGLGMNNNGTGMVLASAALSTLPCALLPVLAYNLVQHLMAGGADRIVRTRRVKRRRLPDLPMISPDLEGSGLSV